MWSDWYVFGYCKERQDFRLYKLRRLWDLQISGEEYEVRVIPDDKLQFGSHMTDDYFVTAIDMNLIRMTIPDKPNSRNQRYVNE